MKTKPLRPRRIASLLASSTFFRITIGLFLFETIWIALTGRYPMAFDEDFHLGIIKIYAHHLSPFWSSQPTSADTYGAVMRDPSYFYQYLMSFPYRLINLFTHDQTIQVIFLRFINVALFASGLPLFKRLLQRTGASASAINASLLIFILIPVVPLLAAQINYDNMLFPLVGVSLLLTLKLDTELKQYKRINIQLLLQLIAVCALTSLVTYPFLPIFLAIIIFLGVRFRQTYATRRKFWLSLGFGFTLLTRRMRWVYLVILIVSLGLFTQRYGINLVRYHKPVPGCGQVLNVQRCQAYGPWARDYNYARVNNNGPVSPFVFTADWFYGMWLRSFFAVDGPDTNYQTRGPLLIPGIMAIVFSSLGLLLVIRYGKRIFAHIDRATLWLLILCDICYIGALWLDEYASFVRTGQPVAINGRYLVPLLLPLILLTILAFRELLAKRPQLKAPALGLAVLCLLWGGGGLTYVLRSNRAWYWPNQTVYDVNHAVQTVIGPLVPGYRHPTEFLH